jgi:hypothetical protein
MNNMKSGGAYMGRGGATRRKVGEQMEIESHEVEREL